MIVGHDQSIFIDKLSIRLGGVRPATGCRQAAWHKVCKHLRLLLGRVEALAAHLLLFLDDGQFVCLTNSSQLESFSFPKASRLDKDAI